jgi:hypothetical protein
MLLIPYAILIELYYCCRPANFSEKTFFFFFIRKTSPGSEKKKVFMKNLPGASNILLRISKVLIKRKERIGKNSCKQKLHVVT